MTRQIDRISQELVKQLGLQPVVGERLDLNGQSFIVAEQELYYYAWRLARSPAQFAWLEVVRVVRMGWYRALWAVYDAGFGYVEEMKPIRVRDLFRPKRR